MTTAPVSWHRDYLSSLTLELDLTCDSWLAATDTVGAADTLYFGGGTPSLVATQLLGELIELLRNRQLIRSDCSIFLEVNPEDLTLESIAEWRELGVRTITLGVQAFNDASLTWLGRGHDARRAQQSVELAKQSGMEAVSVDLIYGLPQQDSAEWERELELLISLEPDHVSCYQLTIHDSTPFGKRQLHGEKMSAELDCQADLFRLTHTVLGRGGYTGYEVSNFARGREFRSRHNQKYWNHTPYLGLGPSAHSFDGSRRRWNLAALRPWQCSLLEGAVPTAGEERLSPVEMMLEFVMLRLRTTDGLELSEFEREFGVDLAGINDETIRDLTRRGLLGLSGDTLIPTLDGLAVADSVAAGFRFGPEG